MNTTITSKGLKGVWGRGPWRWWDEGLRKLWDLCAGAGYKSIYRVHVEKVHKDSLTGLFLPCPNGVYLDAGCGAGNLFPDEAEKIQANEVNAIDSSEGMLRYAEIEAERLQRNVKTRFSVRYGDLNQSLDWPTDSFDGIVCNLVVIHLTAGWKKSLQEFNRVIKPGGYLYLGTTLKNWGFFSVLWKHAPAEFFREPLTSLLGMRFWLGITVASIWAKIKGAQTPTREELVSFLESLGFKEVEIVPTYWGGGIALRARSGKASFNELEGGFLFRYNEIIIQNVYLYSENIDIIFSYNKFYFKFCYFPTKQKK